MAISEITSQRCSTIGSSQTNVWTITYPATPTQGDLLVVGIVWRNDVSVSSISSGWNLASASTAGTDCDCAIYYKIAGASEPTTVTITLSGNSKSALVGTEFSGVNQTFPFDQSSANNGTGTAGTTGNIAPTKQTTELVISLYSNINTYTWGSYDNSQTEILQVTTTGGSPTSKSNLAMSKATTSSKNAVNYGATLSTSGTWAVAGASFRDAAQVFVDVTPTGVSGTGAVGTVIVWQNAQVSATGIEATSSLNSVAITASASTSVTGLAATSALGDVTLVCKAVIPVTGNEATSALGDVTVNESVKFDVTGVSCTGELGTVLQVTGLVQRVTGVSAYMPPPLDVSIWFGIDDAQTPDWVLVPAY